MKARVVVFVRLHPSLVIHMSIAESEESSVEHRNLNEIAPSPFLLSSLSTQVEMKNSQKHPRSYTHSLRDRLCFPLAVSREKNYASLCAATIYSPLKGEEFIFKRIYFFPTRRCRRGHIRESFHFFVSTR